MQVLEPVMRSFAPDLIIVSAGFDAVQGDPLGGMNLTPQVYGHMVSLSSPCSLHCVSFPSVLLGTYLILCSCPGMPASGLLAMQGHKNLLLLLGQG